MFLSYVSLCNGRKFANPTIFAGYSDSLYMGVRCSSYIHMKFELQRWVEELTEEERSYVVGLARGGLSISKTNAEMKRARGTIATILRRFRIRGNVKTAPRSGRPPVTTSRDECSLARLVKQDRRATAKSLTRKCDKVTQKNVGKMTARRRLRSLGYNGKHERSHILAAKIRRKEWNGQK